MGGAAVAAAVRQGCEGGDEGEEEDEDDGLPPLQQNNNRKVRRADGEQQSTARTVWDWAALGRAEPLLAVNSTVGVLPQFVGIARMLTMQSERCMSSSTADSRAGLLAGAFSGKSMSAVCSGSPHVLLGGVCWGSCRGKHEQLSVHWRG